MWLASNPDKNILILIQTYDQEVLRGTLQKALRLAVQSTAMRALHAIPGILYTRHRHAACIAAAIMNVALGFHGDGEVEQQIATLRRVFWLVPGAAACVPELLEVVGRL